MGSSRTIGVGDKADQDTAHKAPLVSATTAGSPGSLVGDAASGAVGISPTTVGEITGLDAFCRAGGGVPAGGRVDATRTTAGRIVPRFLRGLPGRW